MTGARLAADHGAARRSWDLRSDDEPLAVLRRSRDFGSAGASLTLA